MGAELTQLITILFVVAAVVFGYKAIMKRSTDMFYRLMEETNRKYGTEFPMRREDVHLVLGTNSRFGIFAFDPKNSKLAYVTNYGRTIEILDIQFIRTWKITWEEQSRTTLRTDLLGVSSIREEDPSTAKVQMVFATNDLRRPTLTIPVPSLSYARDWSERLNVLCVVK